MKYGVPVYNLQQQLTETRTFYALFMPTFNPLLAFHFSGVSEQITFTLHYPNYKTITVFACFCQFSVIKEYLTF